MESGRAWRVAFVLFLAVAACRGPLGPIPGGRLSGTVVENPVRDWSFAERYRYAQVETRPADPHSVNVHFYVVAGRLYLDIGRTAGNHLWRRYIREDPRVRVRFGDRVYPLVAVPVTKKAEIEKLLVAYYEKDRDEPPPGCEPPYTGQGCTMPTVFVRLVWLPPDWTIGGR